MKVLGLLLTALGLGFFFYWQYGRSEPAAVAPSEATTLGAAPPSDVGRNAKAAKDYSTRQVCLADCTSEERTCAATAAEQAGIEACAQAKTACEAKCPSDAR